MKLPVAFKDKMKGLLGETEYTELIEALNRERQYGLRVNTLKTDLENFKKVSPFQLEPVPWTADGFYISAEDAPGRHPYYHAGAYYIQEPSAMLPGQILGAQPGERVLDLCAAPGGKTVQIAAAMKGKGLLVSNDISADRVKALVKNIELCGVRNAIVLNESPEMLVRNFEGYFDRVIIDAPCSGEGMFRKDEAAAKSWESFKCERCTKLQEPILQSADRLLRPGGTLVYSTCTFSPEEDEQMIAKFIQQHEEYELAEIPKIAGIEGGRAAWAGGDTAFERAARLWPHRVKGEGHFTAKMIKMIKDTDTGITGEIGFDGEIGIVGGTDGTLTNPDDGFTEACSSACTLNAPGLSGLHFRTKPTESKPTETEPTETFDNLPESFRKFVRDNMNHLPEGVYLQKGHNLYHLPEAPPKLDGLKVAKFGWFLGTFEDNRFEPSHSMVTALEMKAFKRSVNLDAASREVGSYLKGETVMLDGEKGFTAVCVNGWTLGWAKQTGDMLKNLYPKGWRRLS
jgi:NOL1/NOP2/sun family putative RNA methylase